MKKPSGFIWTCGVCGKKSAWGPGWGSIYGVAVVCSDACENKVLESGYPSAGLWDAYVQALREFRAWKKENKVE